MSVKVLWKVDVFELGRLEDTKSMLKIERVHVWWRNRYIVQFSKTLQYHLKIWSFLMPVFRYVNQVYETHSLCTVSYNSTIMQNPVKTCNLCFLITQVIFWIINSVWPTCQPLHSRLRKKAIDEINLPKIESDFYLLVAPVDLLFWVGDWKSILLQKLFCLKRTVWFLILN